MNEMILPKDFPAADFNAVSEIAEEMENRYRSGHGGNANPMWAQRVAAWLAVANRWQSLANASDEYTDLAIHGTQSGADRKREDQAIFAFFMNALSVAETTGFHLQSFGGLFDPASFETVLNAPRSVTVGLVYRTFTAHYPGERVTRAWAALIDAPEFAKIKEVRDILAHRGQPPRDFQIVPPQVILPNGERYPPARPGRHISTSAGLTLDEDMTVRFRAFLAAHLAEVFAGAREFGQARV